MKSKSTINLVDMWATKKGVCLEINEQTNHILKGTFYFDVLTLNRIEFNAIVSDDSERINFVSSIELYIPKLFGDFTVLIQGHVKKVHHDNTNLHMCILIYDKNNMNKACMHSFELHKIKSSEYLKFESFDHFDSELGDNQQRKG